MINKEGAQMHIKPFSLMANKIIDFYLIYHPRFHSMKVDNMNEKVLDFDNLYHNYDGAQMHILPFRAIEEPMLPLGAQSSLLTLWQIKIKQNKSDITAFA